MSKNKRKVLTQRQVCSRMNFLYQAANLMARNNNNMLAAYYGKLCRNLGTKAVMHISPALKRTLCKRCSLPLLPGVNTTLLVDQQQEQRQQHQPDGWTSSNKRKKRRNRRLRGGKYSPASRKSTAATTQQATIDEHETLRLQCCLCQAQRSFHVGTQKECWLERPEAVANLITLADRQETAPSLHIN